MQHEADQILYKKMLKKMLLIRRFEEKAAFMYGLRKIGGFCHLYIGQEAIAVGSIINCNLKKDYIITTYRDHGHALMCGSDPKALMAELFGKASGISKGKGGSMHLFDIKNHFYGGHAIVGGNIPIGVGMAYKIKYKKENGVVLCYFGDGAIHTGAFHESINMAKIWNLPVIFICENNQYGMGTHYKRISAIDELYKISQSYKMYGTKVDGMDVLAVHEASKKLIEKARQGEPVLCEMQTYRYKGHSMSDPAKYRSLEEVSTYKSKDPIITLKSKLIKSNTITEKEYKIIDKEIKQTIDEALAFAEQSENPPPQSLHKDILK